MTHKDDETNRYTTRGAHVDQRGDRSFDEFPLQWNGNQRNQDGVYTVCHS